MKMQLIKQTKQSQAQKTKQHMINIIQNRQAKADIATTRPALQELLKEALNKERKNHTTPLQKQTRYKR